MLPNNDRMAKLAWYGGLAAEAARIEKTMYETKGQALTSSARIIDSRLPAPAVRKALPNNKTHPTAAVATPYSDSRHATTMRKRLPAVTRILRRQRQRSDMSYRIPQNASTGSMKSIKTTDITTK